MDPNMTMSDHHNAAADHFEAAAALHREAAKNTDTTKVAVNGYKARGHLAAGCEHACAAAKQMIQKR
jgi:hypothetical protein